MDIQVLKEVNILERMDGTCAWRLETLILVYSYRGYRYILYAIVMSLKRPIVSYTRNLYVFATVGVWGQAKKGVY